MTLYFFVVNINKTSLKINIKRHVLVGSSPHKRSDYLLEHSDWSEHSIEVVVLSECLISNFQTGPNTRSNIQTPLKLLNQTFKPVWIFEILTFLWTWSHELWMTRVHNMRFDWGMGVFSTPRNWLFGVTRLELTNRILYKAPSNQNTFSASVRVTNIQCIYCLSFITWRFN